MPTGGAFAFGPFVLDPHAERLRRADEPIALSHHHFALLHLFVASPRQVFTKDELVKRVWGTVVDNNSVEKAVLVLRRALDASDPASYIETIRRAGYRFIADVTRLESKRPHTDLDEELAPYRALVEGRGALETLGRDEIARARALFERLVAHYPGDATFHVGLANACVLQFEMTRVDVSPDVAALTMAEHHARQACHLAPGYGEARATLGFVLERTGDRMNALAALREAVALEGDNWRHWLRLSSDAWGEERLRAARKALFFMPEYPLARVLVATVFIARGMLAEAEREVDLAIAEILNTSSPSARFSAVAVYWLKGLFCLVRGADDDAMAAFEQELALEPRGHLYARECAANTWYAIGACRLRQGDLSAAREAFEQAIARVPRHPMARAGLALLISAGERQVPSADARPTIDHAIAHAAMLAANEDVVGAVDLVSAALADTPEGNGGWPIPVEPLLGIQRAREPWARVLSQLRRRAM